MTAPILTFRTHPDGSEDAFVGHICFGAIITVSGEDRVLWRVNLGEGLVIPRWASGTTEARRAIICRISDWYALQGIVKPGELIDMQVERVAG